MDENELSFLDILATPSLNIARYRRDADKNDYLTTLNDLDSRISDVLTTLAAMPNKVNALDESYNSLALYLDDLEESALGESSYLSNYLLIHNLR